MNAELNWALFTFAHVAPHSLFPPVGQLYETLPEFTINFQKLSTES